MKAQTQRRMSVRAVSIQYGIPQRVVARAVGSGALRSIRTVTETGRERAYIAPSDAAEWVAAMTVASEPEKARAQR